MSQPRGRRRGPAPAISRDDIVDAALEHGLAQVTMRDVAERLGVSIQGLYHYVRTRDDLLGAAAARLVDRVVLPEPDGLSWTGWLGATARTIRGQLREHPGVAALALTASGRDGSGVPLLQRGVGVLVDRYGIRPDIAVQAIVGLATVVFAQVAQVESIQDRIRDAQAADLPLDPDRLFDFTVGAYLAGLPVVAERGEAG